MPGLVKVRREEGIDGVRYALWDATGWHRDYSPSAWRNRATAEQKRIGWEMAVRMEKIIATVLTGSPRAAQSSPKADTRGGDNTTTEQGTQRNTSSPTSNPPAPKGQTVGSSGSEASLRQAVKDYYEAVDREDWDYTYDHLDSKTQRTFTKAEWKQKNQWITDHDQLKLSSIDLNLKTPLSGSEADVKVNRTFTDGSSIVRDTRFVFEGGYWKHQFLQEEIELFMPGTSFDEFVKAQQEVGSSDTSLQPPPLNGHVVLPPTPFFSGTQTNSGFKSPCFGRFPVTPLSSLSKQFFKK